MLHLSNNIALKAIKVVVSEEVLFIPVFLNTVSGDSYVSFTFYTLIALIEQINLIYGTPRKKIIDFILNERMSKL